MLNKASYPTQVESATTASAGTATDPILVGPGEVASLSVWEEVATIDGTVVCERSWDGVTYRTVFTFTTSSPDEFENKQYHGDRQAYVRLRLATRVAGTFGMRVAKGM